MTTQALCAAFLAGCGLLLLHHMITFGAPIAAALMQ